MDNRIKKTANKSIFLEVIKAIEEIGELQDILAKSISEEKTPIDAVASELADVSILIDRLRASNEYIDKAYKLAFKSKNVQVGDRKYLLILACSTMTEGLITYLSIKNEKALIRFVEGAIIFNKVLARLKKNDKPMRDQFNLHFNFKLDRQLLRITAKDL